jgi:hypothetical protein
MMSCIKVRSVQLWLSGFLAAVFLLGNPRLKADESSQDTYLKVYVRLHDAENMEKAGDYLAALIVDRNCLAWLQQCARWDPRWETAILLKRIKELQETIAELKPLAVKQYLAANKSPLTSAPGLSSIYDDGLRLQKANDYHDYWQALDQFVTYQTKLEIIHSAYSSWISAFAAQRLKEVQVRIDETAKSIVQEELKAYNTR